MAKGEFEIIKDFFEPIAKKNKQYSLSLQDDAGIIPSPSSVNKQIVVTKDAIVEGYHYLPSDPPESVAKKLLRVSVSDVASMGAMPTSCVIASFYKKNLENNWIKRFSKALEEDLEKYNMSLIGGDTVKSPTDKNMFSLTAFGEVEKDNLLLRSNAKKGDLVYVSGTIGDAAVGLEVLQEKLEIKNKLYKDFLINRYRYPEPRVDLGNVLHEISSTCMDISDGLCADIKHICQSSNVGAKLFIDKIPLSPALKELTKKQNKYFEKAITGGDDYELLFTINKKFENQVEKLSEKSNTKITKIGKIEEKKKQDLTILDENNQEIKLSKFGYTHF